jgi:hypothetical protein
MFSFYLARKKERIRLEKVKMERKSLHKIQAELQALKQGISI